MLEDEITNHERPLEHALSFAQRLQQQAPIFRPEEFGDDFEHAADYAKRPPRRRKTKPPGHGPAKRSILIPRKPSLPETTHPRPRCPACGGKDLHQYRTERSNQFGHDGYILAWVKCKNRGCDLRFRLWLT